MSASCGIECLQFAKRVKAQKNLSLTQKSHAFSWPKASPKPARKQTQVGAGAAIVCADMLSGHTSTATVRTKEKLICYALVGGNEAHEETGCVGSANLRVQVCGTNCHCS